MVKNLLNYCFNTALSFLREKTLPPPSPFERKLIEELRANTQTLARQDLKRASQAEDVWLGLRRDLHQLILHNDPRQFLRWKVIQLTMFAVYDHYDKPELKFLKKHPDWQRRWLAVLKESPVGDPPPYYRFPQSSGNLIHHTYHLAQFENHTNTSISDLDFIFEFGGGYGSLCRVCHNLSFKGVYIIFDLPEVSLLQKFYLKSLGLKINQDQERQSGIYCISDQVQLINWFKENFHPGLNSLFLANWSLSETPMDFRQGFLAQIPLHNFYLLTYQHCFKEIDNQAFFSNWRLNSMSNYLWHDWEIPHMPNDRYLIGSKK